MKITNEGLTSYRYYYEFSNTKQPLIEVMYIKSDIKRSGVIGVNEIIFVLQGKCEVICDIYPPVTLTDRESVFIPSGSHFRAHAPEGSKIIVFRLDPLQKVYGSYSVEELYTESQNYSFPEDAGILEINPMMHHFLIHLSYYLEHGMTNTVLYEIKIKELLLILHSFYETKNLCYFFKPILNNDYLFAAQIFEHWEQAKNAKELADLVAYTPTSFNKKFKQVFGVTPYKWLNERKSAKILYEITNTDQPLKLIAENYDFNSQQQFNDYCIRNFRQTPGAIRNGN